MAVPCFPKKPDFAKAMTGGKTRDFDIPTAMVRTLWERMRNRYLDEGVSLERAAQEMGKEYNFPTPELARQFFYEVATGMKRSPLKTRALFEREAKRALAKFQAEQFIQRSEMTVPGKVTDTLAKIPRAGLVFAHAGVFPGTHAGALLWRPTRWVDWGKSYVNTWKALSPTEYESLRNDILSDEHYALQRAGMLRISIDERPQGFLSDFMASKPTWGQRGWIGVLKLRQDEWNNNWDRFIIPAGEELAFSRALSPIANHATGVVEDPHFWGVLGKAQFAPQLTASKILRATYDPVLTAKTLLSNPVQAFAGLIGMTRNALTLGRYKVRVSSPEMAAALTRTRNAMEYFIARESALRVNQALLTATGSQQQINLSDKSKGDWKRFKTGTGLIIADRGLEDMYRAMGQMAFIMMSQDPRARHGRGVWGAEFDVLTQMAQYKLEPGMETLGELMAGEDIFQRPLPKFIQVARRMIGLPERMPTGQHRQISTLEYGAGHLPLAVNGPMADMFDKWEDTGLPPTDLEDIFNFGLGLFLHGVLGMGTRYESDKPKLLPGKSHHAGRSGRVPQ